jgi:hypothetical protein
VIDGLLQDHALMPVLLGEGNAECLHLLQVGLLHDAPAGAFKSQLLLEGGFDDHPVHLKAPVTAECDARMRKAP